MIDKLFNRTQLYERALDASWKRNEVIANNIANVDTPNFKKSSVQFETELASALQQDHLPTAKTHSGHRDFHTRAGDVRATVTEESGTTMRLDGNNVDIEQEMVQLAKNNIYYASTLTKLNGEFKRMRIAITDRG